MHHSSLDYIRCVSCNGLLDIRIFEQTNEIDEGVLECVKCKKQYPIISSVALILNDLPAYFSIREKLGGNLMIRSKNKILKDLMKNVLKKVKKQDDTSKLEQNWVQIYKKSKNSKFYSKITNVVESLPKSNLSIEHGCSIGTITHKMSKNSNFTFGIDKSFYAIEEAKKINSQNCDFFVADSLSHPFGKTKFDIVIGLNLLELIEPREFVDTLSKQVKKFLILSDPYDYERGKNSVKEKWDEKMLRGYITKKGFTVSHNTQKPTYYDWNLIVNPRLKLHYKVDVIVAKKR